MTNKQRIFCGVVYACLFFLTGCATPPPIETPIIKVDKVDLNALQELAKVSVEVRDEMRLLAKTQEGVAQAVMTEQQREERYIQATTIPRGFEVISDFYFVGKASSAAKALALATGYDFFVNGKPLKNEPWVSINFEDKPLNEALRELGMQTGSEIDIQLHSNVFLFTYINNGK